jgi:hypothetical protein
MLFLVSFIVAMINLNTFLNQQCFPYLCRAFARQQILFCVRVLRCGLCERLCCYGVCERSSLRTITMARQNTSQCMFKSIDKEEMHVHAEREFESLGKRLELEKAIIVI